MIKSIVIIIPCAHAKHTSPCLKMPHWPLPTTQATTSFVVLSTSILFCIVFLIVVLVLYSVLT